MADQEASDKGEEERPLPKAADRIRESAKWLIASFAAVGALLIAGLQIADIGSLTGNRLAAAIAGIVVGVLGVIIAIGAASSVVAKSFVTLKELAAMSGTKDPRKSIDGDKVLLGGRQDVCQLEIDYEAAVTARVGALKAFYEGPTADTKSAAQAATNWALALDRIATNVLDRASFLTLARHYFWARWIILVGAGITAIGITIFAWAANPPAAKTAASVVEKTPTNVTVIIDHPNKTLISKLGKKCDLSSVQAVAIADMGANYQVTSIPTTHCKAALFVVTPQLGRVVLQEADSGAGTQQKTTTANAQ